MLGFDQKKKVPCPLSPRQIRRLLHYGRTADVHRPVRALVWQSIKGGQRFTRKQALDVVVKAYRRHQLQENAKNCAVPSTVGAEAASATAADKEVVSARISSMKVSQLKEELGKHNLNDSGLKAELIERLCEHYKCPVPQKKERKETGKHRAKWSRKQTKINNPCAFTDDKFNDESLPGKLPGFPDRMPEPWECHNFFYTDEMWDLGHHGLHAWPKWVAAQEVRPPWTPKNQPWPPVWVQRPLDITLEVYKFFVMLLYMMGAKRLARNNLRAMFSNDELMQEQWLKGLTTRDRFEAFLRQLHFEDSGDPWGKKFPHSTNYRPNGVPKVTTIITPPTKFTVTLTLTYLP